MNEHDLEQRLGRLRLAQPSDNYLSRGQALIHMVKPVPAGWRGRLLPALALALVLSVSANMFQLVRSNPVDTAGTEQLAQCQTPTAASSVATEKFELASLSEIPESRGMC